MARAWDVLLVGGASGVGKSEVSYRLAQQMGVALCEVDDLNAMVLAMTTPAQQPAVHFWRTHPAPETLGADEILTRLIAHSAALSAGMEAVIANHLETRRPVVLEGDFILPALAAQTSFGREANQGRVRAVFVIEEDEAQIAANFLAREPAQGPQLLRANVSWRHGQWLEAEAARLGLPVVAARPWENVVERVMAVCG